VSLEDRLKSYLSQPAPHPECQASDDDDAVGHHHAAERAPGRDLRRAGIQRLLHALVVDALADVFLHPHPRTACAAAQAAVGVAGHLGEVGAGGPDQLA
jgi:hypothetical protein